MNKLIPLLAILMTMLVVDVFALGVASDFVGPDGKTLYLEKGQTYDYGIRIQNVQGEDTSVRVDVVGAEILDPRETYLLPARTTKNEIKMRITMPNDANQKTTVPVTWTVTEVPSNSGGQVSTAKQITGGIQAMLPRSPAFAYWNQVFGAIALVTVASSIVISEKRKNKNETKAKPAVV